MAKITFTKKKLALTALMIVLSMQVMAQEVPFMFQRSVILPTDKALLSEKNSIMNSPAYVPVYGMKKGTFFNPEEMRPTLLNATTPTHAPRFAAPDGTEFWGSILYADDCLILNKVDT